MKRAPLSVGMLGVLEYARQRCGLLKWSRATQVGGAKAASVAFVQAYDDDPALRGRARWELARALSHVRAVDHEAYALAREARVDFRHAFSREADVQEIDHWLAHNKRVSAHAR